MIIKHPEPLRGFDYIGLNYYSITWCCDRRKPFFSNAAHVDLVRKQFLRAASETEIAIVAECFMPDHVHKLVKGCSPRADGRRYMKLAKQYSGYYFKQAYREALWQRYGHDRFLRKDDEPRTIVRYILENPVRAGLVGKVEDYPFIDSQLHTLEELIEWAYTY
jgi:putative transposase